MLMKSRMLFNQSGISTIEAVPVLLLFALLFNFSLGFFGVIHSGILNSIAARNYAFETFRNRSNLTYLRDEDSTPGEQENRYTKIGYRFHGVISEGHAIDTNYWPVTRRPIKFTEAQTGKIDPVGVESDHNQLVRQVADNGKASDVFSGRTPEDGRSGVSPVWVQVLYGICLNKSCRKVP